MDPKPDEELVREVQDGSISAFEILVKKYENRLISFIYRILNNRADAEEVVQDTFFNVYLTIDRVDVSRKFSTYLFEIAKNQAISLLRKKHADLVLEDETAIETDEKIYEGLIRKEQRENIGLEVAKLEAKYRRVVQLYYFDDLSYEEISAKLKLPVNTVRTHLLRAKEILRKNIKYENI